MPGEVSQSNPGIPDDAPYVPSWCYADQGGPQMCVCGHHEGYHGDGGDCVNKKRCGCDGFKAAE